MRFVGRVGACAALDFDRGVIEAELVFQPRLDALHDGVVVGLIADYSVQRHHAAATG